MVKSRTISWGGHLKIRHYTGITLILSKNMYFAIELVWCFNIDPIRKNTTQGNVPPKTVFLVRVQGHTFLGKQVSKPTIKYPNREIPISKFKRFSTNLPLNIQIVMPQYPNEKMLKYCSPLPPSTISC